MIAKWPGKCSLCGKAVPTGMDVNYDATTKTVQHYECLDNPQPTSRCWEISDECGFLDHGVAVNTQWPNTPTRREVLLLLSGAAGSGDERGQREAHGNTRAVRDLFEGKEN